jgi:hypothetical protein
MDLTVLYCFKKTPMEQTLMQKTAKTIDVACRCIFRMLIKKLWHSKYDGSIERTLIDN